MVGILLSFWDGLFSGAFAVSFREGTFWDGAQTSAKVVFGSVAILKTNSNPPNHRRKFVATALYLEGGPIFNTFQDHISLALLGYDGWKKLHKNIPQDGGVSC